MMRRPFEIAFASLWIVAAAAAQDVGPFRVRIETAREGMHRVSGAAISAARPDVRVDPGRLRMTREGKLVAIHVQGGADGIMHPADDVFFYAPRPTNPHSKTETFILEDVGPTWFYRPGETSREVRPPSGDPSLVRVSESWREQRVFDPLNTMNREYLRSETRPYWWSASIPPKGSAEGVVNTELRGLPDAAARLKVVLYGASIPGISQSVAVSVNGAEVAATTWDTPGFRELDILVPGAALRQAAAVIVENRSTTGSYLEPGDDMGSGRQNRLLVKEATLIYETRLASPSVSRKQTALRIVGSGSGNPRRLTIESRIQAGFQAFDPVGGTWWRKGEADVADAAEIPFAILTAEGAYEPIAVAAASVGPHPLETEGDYVVVTVSRFRSQLDALVKHRAADGLKPAVVEIRSLYDAFAHGRAGPGAIMTFLREATARWKTKPKYLLLVGDADLDVVFLSERETLPTNLVATAYNGATASDAAFGDLDGDGVPELAVGRLPARTPEDLLKMTSRIVRAETGPPSGAWRRRAAFFAGEGRFGPAIDAMIENVAGNLVAKEIPPEYSVSMTYANPRSAWFWPAASFNEKLIGTFNEGAALFTYIGHGFPQGFDRVDFEGKRYAILLSKDVARLDNEGRAGLVSIIACSTGHFDDAERDCIAETMLAKEGGPLAVFASTRISHPFANALLGQGLVKAGFAPGARIGDVVNDAKRRMLAESKGMMAMLAKPHVSKAVTLDELLKDHVHLYALFGDPASKLPFAETLSAFEAPETAVAGAEAPLSLKAPADGRVFVALERPRTALLKAKGGESSDAKVVEARHAAANEVVVATVEGATAGGAWRGSLAIPAGLADGEYVLTAYVSGSTDAIAVRRIRLEPAR